MRVSLVVLEGLPGSCFQMPPFPHTQVGVGRPPGAVVTVRIFIGLVVRVRYGAWLRSAWDQVPFALASSLWTRGWTFPRR